jgi:hypothetical protein
MLEQGPPRCMNPWLEVHAQFIPRPVPPQLRIQNIRSHRSNCIHISYISSYVTLPFHGLSHYPCSPTLPPASSYLFAHYHTSISLPAPSVIRLACSAMFWTVS